MDTAGATGIMLSGGLDSSAVGCLARRRGATLRAYSAVFPAHPEVDESGLIDVLVAHLDATSTRAVVRSGSVVAAALEHVERWMVPPTSPNLFFWEPLLQRAGDDGVRVLLDGEGGDELFGLSPYLIADRLRSLRLLSVIRLVRSGGLGPHPPARVVCRVLAGYGLRGIAPHVLQRRIRSWRNPERYAPAWLTPELQKLHLQATDQWAWKQDPGPRWLANLRYRVTGPGSAAALEHVRRRGADAGLRATHPLFDPDLIDLVMRFPPESAWDPHLSRPLFRQSLTGVVPDRIRLRGDKSHFDAVFHDALTTTDLPVIRWLLTDSSSEAAAYVVPSQVQRLLSMPPSSFPGGTTPWAIYVWRLTTLELWLRSLNGTIPNFADLGVKVGEPEVDLQP